MICMYVWEWTKTTLPAQCEQIKIEFFHLSTLFKTFSIFFIALANASSGFDFQPKSCMGNGSQLNWGQSIQKWKNQP